MIKVSESYNYSPDNFKTELQKKVYDTLNELSIRYERVDTSEAITMEDCLEIEKKLNVKMVKTLFLCNQQKTKFYLFVTTSSKRFDSKIFSRQLQISRVSFANEELMLSKIKTKIGSATIFGLLMDETKEVQLVIDKEVLNEEYYGCSDGTTTGYMKITTKDILDKVIPCTNHEFNIIEM